MNRLPKAPDVPDFADDLAGRIDDAERLGKIHAALSTLRARRKLQREPGAVSEQVTGDRVGGTR